MQHTAALVIFGVLALCAPASSTEDKVITKVVKLLQGILETSKTQGEAERVAYAKYICDCDKRSTEYKDTIGTSDEQITLLANQIAELQADTGKLSTECAQLKADMASNELARQEALNLRNNQNGKFEALKTDLTGAIGQLENAIKTLVDVSADQTSDSATGADHTKFMSGYKTKYNPVSLVKARSSLQSALFAASAFMDKKKANVVTSFMQAPFTGSYTSQSVEVMGILKNMKDTFESNLQQATDVEAAQLKAYLALKAIKETEYSDMSSSYDKKQGQLSTNDAALSAKKVQKATTEETMEEAETFLAQTEEMCKDKKAEYSKRRMLQTQEEAAISEAISILDSDAAFAVFGTVTATSSGSASLMQLKSIRKHTAGKDDLRSELMQTLQKVKGSKRLARLAAMVQAFNPFEVVLQEIDKMLELIVEEGKEDKSNLDFCNTERTTNDATIAEKTKAIEEVLTPKILKLDQDINHPEDGLKKQISDTEASLLENQKTQKESTETRTKENLAYQTDMKNLAEAKATITKAIDVLEAYYAKLLKEMSLMQKQPKSSLGNTLVPTEDTAVLKMKGESDSGNAVVATLKIILGDTEAEEKDAVAAEKKSQADYDSAMTTLKGEESSLQSTLVQLEQKLAETEKDLLTTKDDKKKTEAEKAAAEDYLASIKPGCDFITTNMNLREANRLEETKALNTAIEKLKGTPVYLTYKSEVYEESLGKCVSECKGKDDTAVCKACLGDVTVPAYCAGHKETPGC